MNNNKINFTLIQVICIIILGFLVYANSLSGQFLWDDYCYVKENNHIKDFTYLPRLFTEDVGAGCSYPSFFYRPLQMFTYMVNYAFNGINVYAYHFVNILLHIMAALALFWMIKMIFNEQRLAFLTALLFVSHPVQVEAVASISGRADPLSTVFLLLCIICYLKDKPIAAALSFVFALLSKESSLLVPVLILLYHYTFKKKINARGFLPLLFVALGYFFLRVFILHSLLTKNLMPYTPDLNAFLRRIPGFFVAVATYVRIIFVPINLRAHYGEYLFSPADPKSIFGLLLICFLLIYALNKKNKDKLVFFSIFWFFITLLPATNIYKINFSFMKEHWLYLPAVGWFLLISRALLSLYDIKRLRKIGTALIVILLLLYSSLTMQQNNYWKNGIVFMKRSLHYLPDCPIFYNELGREYRNMGRFNEAAEYYKKVIQLAPGANGPYYNLSSAYEANGKFKEAALVYEMIVELDSPRAANYYKLGDLYDKAGQKEKVVKAYERAIAIDPQYLEAYNNLASVYADSGEVARAIELWNRLLEIEPNFATAHFNLAVFYYQQKKYALALKHCDKVIELGYKVDPEFFNELERHRK